MAFVTKPEAFIISEIKSTIMDRLHMGGSFLEQSSSVTVGGSPVAIKQGGSLGSLGSALSAVTNAVQLAGDIAALVQNPMSLVESAVGTAISGVSTKLSAISSQLTAGQISSITSSVSGLSTKLSDFQAHTSNLSGLSSAISETVPDFNKITNIGNTLQGFGNQDATGFVSNTATALNSSSTLTEIKDKLSVTVQSKMNQIAGLDKTTQAAQITTLVNDINTLLNNQGTIMNTIVTTDTHNFNEAANNLTASQDVVGLAEQFNNTSSVSYALLVGLGVAKTSTINSFQTAIEQSEIP